jgi:UDP-N-acetylmuramate-alanine ligase
LKKNGADVEFFHGAEVLARSVKSGDIVLTLGAGDVWKIGEEILKLI